MRCKLPFFVLTAIIMFASCKKDDGGHDTSIVEFNTLYGGSGEDGTNQIITTSDGGYVVAGFTQSNDGDLSGENVNIKFPQAWVFKLDKKGRKLWSKAFGNTAFNLFRGIVEAPDGGYVMAGVTLGSNQFEQVWLVKLDGSGNIIWNKTYGGTDADGAFSVVNGIDGGYVVAGSTKSKDGDVTGVRGEYDFWVLKVDGTGGLIWQKTYGGPQSDGARSIIVTTDGNYLVCGSTTSGTGDVSGNHGLEDGWLIKIDTQGNKIWQKTVGGSMEEFSNAVSNTPDGGFITTGYSYSNDGDILGSHGSADAFVVKLDKNGNKVWSKTYGGSNFDGGSSIISTSSGNYILSGASMSTDYDLTNNFGKQDAWVLKINSEGKLLQQKTFGGSEFEVFAQVISGTKGGYVFLGSSSSNNGNLTGNHGLTDGWVLTMKDF